MEQATHDIVSGERKYRVTLTKLNGFQALRLAPRIVGILLPAFSGLSPESQARLMAAAEHADKGEGEAPPELTFGELFPVFSAGCAALTPDAFEAIVVGLLRSAVVVSTNTGQPVKYDFSRVDPLTDGDMCFGSDSMAILKVAWQSALLNFRDFLSGLGLDVVGPAVAQATKKADAS